MSVSSGKNFPKKSRMVPKSKEICSKSAYVVINQVMSAARMRIENTEQTVSLHMVLKPQNKGCLGIVVYGDESRFIRVYVVYVILYGVYSMYICA